MTPVEHVLRTMAPAHVPSPVLILFDIDATLITTHRSGVVAMERAGRAIFGPSFTVDRTDFAGRLDPLILADLLRDNQLEVSPANLAQMRDGYRRTLPDVLRERAAHCNPCPGVPQLLDALRPRTRAERGGSGITLGLLTGNYPDTGEMKLRACGIDIAQFSIRVWGDESPHDPPARDHLPEIGLCRYRERVSRELDPADAVIIGDTPHDVACAKAHGLRCLGVATGIHSVPQLAAAGADLALPNLVDTASVLDWLLEPITGPRRRSSASSSRENGP